MLVQEKVRFYTSCKIIGMLFSALLDPANHDTKQASKKVYIQMKKNKKNIQTYCTILSRSWCLCVQVTFFPLRMVIIQLMDINITTTSLVFCLIIPFSQLLKYF